MYIAYGAQAAQAEDVCLFGTTMLHMDMADAVNVMVYVQPDASQQQPPPGAAHTPSGGGKKVVGTSGRAHGVAATRRRGSSRAVGLATDELRLRAEWPTAGAVWDIWAAEDGPRLTRFLWRIAAEEGDGSATKIGHPIHDANVYLTASLRRRLWEEEGVLGYRFLQCEGDAVFIPAGCPHQVYNLRSSIKVAEDFVSPEHIERCLTITQQFRALPMTHRRKQDALGAKDILLHSVAHSLSVLGEGVAHGGASAPWDETNGGIRLMTQEELLSSEEEQEPPPAREGTPQE